MKQCDVKGRNFTLKTVFKNCVALSNQGFINWHWEPVLKQQMLVVVHLLEVELNWKLKLFKLCYLGNQYLCSMYFQVIRRCIQLCGCIHRYSWTGYPMVPRWTPLFYQKIPFLKKILKFFASNISEYNHQSLVSIKQVYYVCINRFFCLKKGGSYGAP